MHSPAEVFDRQRRRAPLALAWWNAAGAPTGQRVLDVGCGPGFVSLLYAAWGAYVFACDNDDASIAYLRPKAPANLMPLVADAERDELPPAAAAFVTDVLHHADPAKVLANLRKAVPKVLVAEFDPSGPEDWGPPRVERLPPERLIEAMRATGWKPGPVVRQADEHYFVVDI